MGGLAEPAGLAERRARAQLLDRGARSVEDAVRHMLAVAAQEMRSARLALRARVPGSTAADVDRGLADRTLAVGWLGRGTLHLVHRDDYAWLLALTAPARRRMNERRLEQEGVEPAEAERGVELVERALADDGPLTRDELRERLTAAGVSCEGQALPHILLSAALRGTVVLGPPRGAGPAFVLARDWLGADAPQATTPDLTHAVGELARRYLVSHGPAGEADLAAWAGLPVRAARAGLRAIAAELEDVGGGLVQLRRADGGGTPGPRLLPSFDPYMLGWKNRSFAVPAEHARSVHPGGGIVRAVILVGARAAGTWGARRAAGKLTVTREPFEPLSEEDEAALDDEERDLARFEALQLA
jgi:hypothetical protein